MDSGTRDDAGYHEFAEVDPTGRYGRYDEVLGKGASKTVYRAFDEYEGIEVAWNQVKLYDLSQSPEDLERLYREIHLLKTLKHENIMKFYTSWVDTTNRNINFVTEMFTSGTLRQYRLKHRKVNIRAVKHWCRQILKGLLYLHSQAPPVIHRDLKCDNIFINGNQGEVKIGDLGLAAILQKSHAAGCVGTPEFMAPEVYAEDYNELVDIYSFGMCILEMVTFDYPYSECTHTAQIYRRVVSGKKPEALNKVKDPEVRQFVEKCLASVSLRLPARKLLKDPFLQIDDHGFNMKNWQSEIDFNGSGSLLRQPYYGSNDDYLIRRHHGDSCAYELESDFCYQQFDDETSEINVFGCQDVDNLSDVDITIRGRRREDGIFLRLRIADKEGRVRNIYFPFDIGADTALSVATEMVAELDIIDHDVMQIADMIDGEIVSLVPDWKRRSGIEDSPHCSNTSFSEHCTDGVFQNQVSSNGPCAKNLQVLRCSISECEPAQGRFEEITYQIEGSEQCASGQGSHCDIWAQLDKAEVISSEGSRVIHSNNGAYASDESNNRRGDIANHDDDQNDQNVPKCSTSDYVDYALWDDYENEIRQELRWLKAKYQLQMRELKSQQLEVQSKISSIPTHNNSSDIEPETDGSSIRLPPSRRLNMKKKPLIAPSSLRKQLASCSPDLEIFKKQMCQDGETISECHGPADHMFTANDFYKGLLHPQILHRATSLPVDAIDV